MRRICSKEKSLNGSHLLLPKENAGSYSLGLFRCTEILLRPRNDFLVTRCLSNKSALITKVRRKLYLKPYPTLVVQPNGATYTIRHFEPRKIIKLPLDFSTLSEEEKQIVIEKRKPKKKVVIEEEIEDSFSSKKYVKLLKKKAP